MTMACMGGWCGRRDRCARYVLLHAAQPAERLCRTDRYRWFATLDEPAQPDTMEKPHMPDDLTTPPPPACAADALHPSVNAELVLPMMSSGRHWRTPGTGDMRQAPARDGSADWQQRPSRRGDFLYYADGRCTRMDGTPVDMPRPASPILCSGEAIAHETRRRQMLRGVTR